MLCPCFLGAAPAIIRTCAVSFLLLPFNIFSTYYFQSILKSKAAFIISVGRGLFVRGAFILLCRFASAALPYWLAMSRTELVTALCAAALMQKYIAAG